MRDEVRKRLEESKRYHRNLKAILGIALFSDAHESEDRQHFDLMFRTAVGSVGARLQKAEYHDRYGPHVTFRVRTQSGLETEWKAILAGNGPDMFLSAFKCAADDRRVGRWYLLHTIGCITAKAVERSNRDGSSLVRVQLSDVPGAVHSSGNRLKLDPQNMTLF